MLRGCMILSLALVMVSQIVCGSKQYHHLSPTLAVTINKNYNNCHVEESVRDKEIHCRANSCNRLCVRLYKSHKHERVFGLCVEHKDFCQCVVQKYYPIIGVDNEYKSSMAQCTNIKCIAECLKKNHDFGICYFDHGCMCFDGINYDTSFTQKHWNTLVALELFYKDFRIISRHRF